jgi:hypothetical protein
MTDSLIQALPKIVERGKKEEQSPRISTFLDFRKGYDEKAIATLLMPARQFVSRLDESKVSEIMKQLYEVVKKLEKETHVQAVFQMDRKLENYEDIS